MERIGRNMEELNLHHYLHTELKCNCGKIHSTNLREIEISKGALEKLPKLIFKYKYEKICIISDKNTYKAAGEKVIDILNAEQIENYSIVLREENLIPNEVALGEVIVRIEPDCDLIIAVGSGTINDISKFISYKLSIDYYVVATAPSMDGFASNVSALITNQLKTTYETHVPIAIIGDINILTEAPMDMIIAGIGDILGKYVCLLDWKIASIIQGEYHCTYIESMVQKSLNIIISNGEKVKDRDPQTIQYIMEGLVLSGIAMSYAGNSRPASGSEHHLSHYWEMMFLFQGKEPVLHGIKVGIGTIVAINLYEKLLDSTIDFKSAKARILDFNLEEWKKEIRKVYQIVWEDIIKLEEETQKNSKEKVLGRLDILESNWEEIKETIREYLPSSKDLIKLMESIGAPVRPEQIGVSKEMLCVFYDLSLYE